MADDELRELERAWHSSGVIDAGIRWHRARLRMGVVDLDGLRLEAAAGDRAAWATLDVPPLIVRLDTWLRREAPGLIDGFNQPAAEAELTEAEDALGQRFPPLLRALYLWRNGRPRGFAYGIFPEVEMSEEQIDEYLAEQTETAGFELDPPSRGEALHPELWPAGWRLLSLREVREAWEARVRQPAQTAEQPWPQSCVPFMLQSGGNLRCVDLSGAQTGVLGQVVEGEDGIERIVAHSLERWLEVLVAALEQEAWSPAGDDERVDYFARVVNPGWPLEVEEDEVRLERAHYDETTGDMVGHFTLCSGCLSCLGCGPALMVALGVVLWREGTAAFSGNLWSGVWDVVRGVVFVSALIAAPIAIWMFVDARIRHRRLLREFEDATLTTPRPPDDGEPG